MSLAMVHEPKEVEVHFDAGKLDHPVVPIRWCLSPIATAKMRQNPEKDWALVIVAQKATTRNEAAGVDVPGNPRHEARVIVEGFRNIAESFGFMTFRAPGDYHVAAYLISSPQGKSNRASFWKSVRALDRRQHGVYEKTVDMFDGERVVEKLNLDSSGTAAFDHVEVSIPDGIFAKPLSEGVKRQLNFFGLGVGEDECAGRWRIALAYTVLPVVFALYVVLGSLVVRLWLLILGVLHLLVGGNPIVVWQEILAPGIKPNNVDTFWMSYEFELIPFYKKSEPRMTFMPLVLLLAGGLAWLGALMQNQDLWPWLGGAVAILVGLFILFKSSDSLGAMAAKSYVDKRTRTAYAGIDRIERFAACGADDRTTTRKFVFSFSGVKRLVCKPRAL